MNQIMNLLEISSKRKRLRTDMQKREIYKLENNKIMRQRRSCPRCGTGVFLAEHEDRVTCGRCGYMEIKKKSKQ